jgi:hypothetical protein
VHRVGFITHIFRDARSTKYKSLVLNRWDRVGLKIDLHTVVAKKAPPHPATKRTPACSVSITTSFKSAAASFVRNILFYFTTSVCTEQTFYVNTTVCITIAYSGEVEVSLIRSNSRVWWVVFGSYKKNLLRWAPGPVLCALLLYGSYTAERRQLLLRHWLGQYSISVVDLRGSRLETQLA